MTDELPLSIEIMALLARADGFNEGDHPRDKDGKFGSGGGGEGSSPAPKKKGSRTSGGKFKKVTGSVGGTRHIETRPGSGEVYTSRQIHRA